jgi:hypothetical protein
MIERSIDHKGLYKIVEDNFSELLDSRRDEVEDIVRDLMFARGITKPTQDATIGDHGKDNEEDERGEHLDGTKEETGDARMSDIKMENGMLQDEKMQDVGITNGVQHKEVMDSGNEVDVEMVNGMVRT